MYCRQFISRKGLGHRTPYEILFGETPDISVFKFPFYAKIWYYDLFQSFPLAKMRKGRFLGIVETCDDRFTYIILPVDDEESPPIRHTTLQRSCIQKREENEVAPIIKRVGEQFKLFTKDGMELGSAFNYEKLEKLQKGFVTAKADKYKISEEVMKDVNTTPIPILDNDTDQVETRTLEEDNNGNTEEERDYIDDKMRNEVQSSIHNQHNNTETDEVNLIQEIIGHKWKDGNFMIKVCTNMDDVDWVEFKLLQQDAPNMLSTYVMRNHEQKKGERFHIRHVR